MQRLAVLYDRTTGRPRLRVILAGGWTAPRRCVHGKSATKFAGESLGYFWFVAA